MAGRTQCWGGVGWVKRRAHNNGGRRGRRPRARAPGARRPNCPSYLRRPAPAFEERLLTLRFVQRASSPRSSPPLSSFSACPIHPPTGTPTPGSPLAHTHTHTHTRYGLPCTGLGLGPRPRGGDTARSGRPPCHPHPALPPRRPPPRSRCRSRHPPRRALPLLPGRARPRAGRPRQGFLPVLGPGPARLPASGRHGSRGGRPVGGHGHQGHAGLRAGAPPGCEPPGWPYLLWIPRLLLWCTRGARMPP